MTIYIHKQDFDGIKRQMDQRKGGHAHNGGSALNRDRARVANNTYVIRNGGGSFALEFHGSVVVSWRSDGSILFSLCGYDTNSTWDRIRLVLGWGLRKSYGDSTKGMLRLPSGQVVPFSSHERYIVDKDGSLWDWAWGRGSGDAAAAMREAYELGMKRGIRDGRKKVREENHDKIVQQTAYRAERRDYDAETARIRREEREFYNDERMMWGQRIREAEDERWKQRDATSKLRERHRDIVEQAREDAAASTMQRLFNDWNIERLCQGKITTLHEFQTGVQGEMLSSARADMWDAATIVANQRPIEPIPRW